MKKIFIYLASQSPRRSQILQGLGVEFETVISRYDEKTSVCGKERPSRLVQRHAAGKALMAQIPGSKKLENSLILGADTIVYFRGRILGKPASYREAERTLLEMTGKSHWVYTGLVLLDPMSGKVYSGFEKTRVHFHRWGKEKIRSYVRYAQVLDKAGSYAIQCEPCIVKRISGSKTNVIGLPEPLLKELIRKARGRSRRVRVPKTR
ncbi:MAG: septum formation protein Maf [Candidatus Omnitrophica bacterium]|nr:septum formation protein Maf [Candidatus Omnitrophota bacterium]